MTYLLLDNEGNLIDLIDFGSIEDVNAYQLANPDAILEKTDDIEDEIFFEEDESEDEW